MTNWVYTKGLHKLTEGVYTYLQPPGALGGSNAGLIVDGGESLLVDTFYDLNLTGQLLRAVREIPGAEPIKYLVNTHVDGDHIFGNQLVEGAEIISTKACAEELSRDLTPQDYVELIKSAPQMGKAGQYIQMTLGQLDFEGIHLTPPTRTFEGRLDLKIGEKEINLIQVGPAHTEGDLVVYIPGGRVLFSGDVVCTSITPPSWHGPSTNLIKAMDTILALDLDILVPGHGQITDRSSAQLMKDYWEYTTETARNLYDRSVPVLDAGLELGANGKFSHLPLPAVNIINCHMLYREFSGREEPLDKFVIMAQIAETLIPD